jgi:hypothetical protein
MPDACCTRSLACTATRMDEAEKGRDAAFFEALLADGEGNYQMIIACWHLGVEAHRHSRATRSVRTRNLIIIISGFRVCAKRRIPE